MIFISVALEKLAAILTLDHLFTCEISLPFLKLLDLLFDLSVLKFHNHVLGCRSLFMYCAR